LLLPSPPRAGKNPAQPDVMQINTSAWPKHSIPIPSLPRAGGHTDCCVFWTSSSCFWWLASWAISARFCGGTDWVPAWEPIEDQSKSTVIEGEVWERRLTNADSVCMLLPSHENGPFIPWPSSSMKLPIRAKSASGATLQQRTERRWRGVEGTKPFIVGRPRLCHPILRCVGPFRAAPGRDP